MFGLKSESPLADFTDPVFVADMSNKKFNVETRIFTSEKPYSKNRESEIFEMLQNGCAISEGKIFKTLALTYAEQKAGK